MPTIPLHLSTSQTKSLPQNPLPQVLQTPSGLAIVEIQGTLNLPPPWKEQQQRQSAGSSFQGTTKTSQHQRMTGEVKKLPKPIAVIRKRDKSDDAAKDELEISEIIHYKILFSNRPEPVGD
ncbi:uncharacterized protein KY384_004487 [Bacidia gigantensis]|uniref:uncharacterized protein n=1 Tax=Bacidia gigantensis TaxID=2732470 RepID=UPI001D038596|nr:uncharacterized protein KY384_004487 [Bacidia gigantensis]KAG8531129.1 hypothetical protein KY384_004487 [Bacidia gigantensis]